MSNVLELSENEAMAQIVDTFAEVLKCVAPEEPIIHREFRAREEGRKWLLTTTIMRQSVLTQPYESTLVDYKREIISVQCRDLIMDQVISYSGKLLPATGYQRRLYLVKASDHGPENASLGWGLSSYRLSFDDSSGSMPTQSDGVDYNPSRFENYGHRHRSRSDMDGYIPTKATTFLLALLEAKDRL